MTFGVTLVGEPLPIAPALDEVPEKLRGALTCKDGQWRSAYPGVMSSRGRLVVVLPRLYAEAKPETLADASLVFLGALGRVLRDTGRSVAEHALWLAQSMLASDDGWQLLDQIEAALLLLRDHDEHGTIRISAPHASPQAPGAIRWSRTLARSVAVVSGPNVVMADPVQVRMQLDMQHPLTALHDEVCAEIRGLLGRDGGARAGRRTSRPAARAILEQHERALFQDRHRIVAKLLARYLGASGLGEASQVQQVSGLFAFNFPLVWERMLAFVLGPGRDRALPRGTYRGVASTGDPPRGLRLYPDLVIDDRFEGEDVMVVFDAKEYAPAHTGRWPETESIGKQLLYRYLLSDRYQPGQLALEKIGNAFLLPARMANGHHACCAVHDIGGEQGPAPFGRIVCLDVDFERVARAYAAGQRDRALRSAIVDSVMRAMLEVVPGLAP